MRYDDNLSRRDPFRNFNFRILLGGTEVAACRKVSGLTGSVDVVKFRAGSNRSGVEELSPGRVHFEPVTLEAGLTNDRAFVDWATMLLQHESSNGKRAVEDQFRREVTIMVYDLDGATSSSTPVKQFVLHQAWVSKFTAMSELAASANDVLIETIEIQHEGFSMLGATAAV
jgi:phage tail-like protein